MTGYSIGRGQHVGGYVRVALVTMLIGALFVIAPPPALAAPGVSIVSLDSDGTEAPGNAGSYTVVLTELPGASVTVTVLPDGQVTVDKPTLTFTTTDWDSPQTVTVTPVNDSVAEASPHPGVVSHSAAGGGYGGVDIDDYTIAITDNDTAGVLISPTSVSVAEGGSSDSYDVVLTSEPTASVTVTVTPDGQVTVDKLTLTFTTGNWDLAQTVTVTAEDDDFVEGPDTATIEHLVTSSDTDYSPIIPDPVTVSIADNEGPPGLSAIDATGDEDDGPLVFEVVLSGAPLGVPITVNWATADGTAEEESDYIADSDTLIFRPDEPTSQLVPVEIVDDGEDEVAETVLFNLTDNSPIVTIVDPQATGTITDDDNVPPTVSVRITDQVGAPGIEFETGEIVRLEVTVADAGAADSHDVRLYWGDGTPVESFGIAPGGRTFQRTHVYAAVGFETISIVVADEDGGSGSRDAFVNIVASTGAGGGAHRTGLVDPSQGKWYLYNNAGSLVTQFFYGNPGDYPFMGDWDGDGIETPGLYRQSDGYVYLRNSNTQGVADIRFFFGNPGDVPIAGDFNGDGFDTVSIYRPSNQRFYIINKLGSNDGGLGAADVFYTFGNPGDKPFVGDFDGDGVETAGLHRESTGLVYFRNTHTSGNAHAQFLFGDPGDRLVAGDWTGDGVFTPTLFRPSNTTMYFRYTNTQGIADNQFIPTPTGASWLPVSGVTGF